MSNRNKRVCFIIESLNLGGIERFTLNLAEEFLNKKLSVDFFVSNLTGQHMSQVPLGVRVFSGSGKVRNILPFLRYLYTQKPKVLITAHIHISILSIVVCKLARIPLNIIVTVHASYPVIHEDNNVVKTSIFRKLAKTCYPLADRIVAVSEATANDLSHFIDLPRDRIDVIYNPVVTERLFEEAKKPAKHPWFGTSDAPIILGSGRLTKQKDFHTLIRSFAKVRESLNAKLMIMGEGEDRLSLENLISELNLEQDVELIGYIKNPYAYMAQAAVFVLSSLWEALPTVLIEALAIGIPVVATDCQGGSKEILDNGKYGSLVQIGDVDGIAKAIIEALLNKPDKEMLIKRGKEFSAQRSSDQYLKLINHFLMKIPSKTRNYK